MSEAFRMRFRFRVGTLELCLINSGDMKLEATDLKTVFTRDYQLYKLPSHSMKFLQKLCDIHVLSIKQIMMLIKKSVVITLITKLCQVSHQKSSLIIFRFWSWLIKKLNLNLEQISIQKYADYSRTPSENNFIKKCSCQHTYLINFRSLTVHFIQS